MQHNPLTQYSLTALLGLNHAICGFKSVVQATELTSRGLLSGVQAGSKAKGQT